MLNEQFSINIVNLSASKRRQMMSFAFNRQRTKFAISKEHFDLIWRLGRLLGLEQNLNQNSHDEFAFPNISHFWYRNEFIPYTKDAVLESFRQCINKQTVWEAMKLWEEPLNELLHYSESAVWVADATRPGHQVGQCRWCVFSVVCFSSLHVALFVVLLRCTTLRCTTLCCTLCCTCSGSNQFIFFVCLICFLLYFLFFCPTVTCASCGHQESIRWLTSGSMIAIQWSMTFVLVIVQKSSCKKLLGLLIHLLRCWRQTTSNIFHLAPPLYLAPMTRYGT